MTWWQWLLVIATGTYLGLQYWTAKRYPQHPRWFSLFELKPQHMGTYQLEPGHTADSRLPSSIDGINWLSAPLPPRVHLCWPQTRYVGRNLTTLRCPCGGWSRDGKQWISRNSRRKRRGLHQ